MEWQQASSLRAPYTPFVSFVQMVGSTRTYVAEESEVDPVRQALTMRSRNVRAQRMNVAAALSLSPSSPFLLFPSSRTHTLYFSRSH